MAANAPLLKEITGAAVCSEQMAPVKAPTELEPRILHREASHGIAVVDGTLVVLWRTETSTPAVLELAAFLSRLAAEAERFSLLQVIGDQATAPDSSARAALAAMLKDHESRIIASAVVFEGTGFRASVVRSIVIGISMLSRPKCPHTVFASVSEGLAWLSRHREGHAGARHMTSVSRAVDQLRQPWAAPGVSP